MDGTKKRTSIRNLPFSIGIEHPWPEDFQFPDPGSRPKKKRLEQWIDQVLRFSSQYGIEAEGDAWCASQIIGPPRVLEYGDDPLAWAPLLAGNPNDDWLVVKVAHPVIIQQVKIRESLCGGAFKKLELFCYETEEFVTVVEQDARCGQYPPAMRIEDIQIPHPDDDDDDQTTQLVTDTLRLEFSLWGGGQTWYEIDAIQVIGILPESKPKAKPRPSPLASDIATLLKDASTADCTLVVKQEENGLLFRIPVHRGILASRCPLFRKMIDNNELPLGGEQVMVGISLSLLEQILEWIYTGALGASSNNNFNVRDCVALAMISDYFQINDLTEFCIEVFKKSILRVENAAQLYAHFDSGEICIIDRLKQAVLDFLAKEFRDCAQTPEFAKLSQSQLLTVIECYHHQLQEQQQQN